MNEKHLKLFAVCCMVFDHVIRIFPLNELFLPLALKVETTHPTLALFLIEDLPYPFFFIGRLAAPIFLFCVAQGFLHTHSIKRYLCRLLATAILSQPPYILFDLAVRHLQNMPGSWKESSLNILFTLTLGLAALSIYRYCRDKNCTLLGFVAVALAAYLARLLHMEGKEGYILLIFFFYLIQNQPRQRQALFLFPAVVLSRWNLVVWMLTGGGILAVSNAFLNIFGNYLGTLVTLAYNGEKGRTGHRFQWGMYAFYPLHFTILALIGFLRPPF